MGDFFELKSDPDPDFSRVSDPVIIDPRSETECTKYLLIDN